MSRIAPASSRQSFVRRVWKLRTLGFLLAGVAFAGSLPAGAPVHWTWIALFLTCIAWPAAAYARAHRAADAVRAEFSNLLLDSVLVGLWIAAMQFSALPSALAVAMVGFGHVVTRGLRYFLRGTAITLATAYITASLFGLAPRPELDFGTLSLLPLLVAYPMAVGMAMRHLAGRMQRQRKLLDRMVATDGLTGLFNRQHWDWCAEQHLADAAKGRGAALMMVDIDRFKEINDRHGHLFGDEVITTVAHTLRDSMRSHDAVGRYAGDEFAVVLPGVDAAAALAVAERFRRAVAKLHFPGVPALACSVSVGVAVFEPGWNVKDWIRSADHALYESKRAGRDRVSLFSRDAREPVAAQAAGDVARPASNVLALRGMRPATP